MNTSARISRSIGEQGRVRSDRRGGNDDIPWRKARYPCIRSHLDGDDATLAHLPRAKGHRRSWNRAFEKLCVCVCMSLPPLSVCFLLEINYGTRNRIFEMLIFLVELSMGKLTRREGSGFLFFFLKFSTLSWIILK